MPDSGRDKLLSTLDAIMADRRHDLGEPPAPEELLDYQYGRLSEERRQEVEEKLVAFPEAARALADLAAFPEVVPAPGDRRFSEAELTAGWEAFRRRLEADAPVRPAAEDQPAKLAPLRQPEVPPRRGAFPVSWLAAAALAGVAVGGVVGWGLARLASPVASLSAVNVTIAQLTPLTVAGERGTAEPEEVELPGSSEELVLVLSLFEPGDYPDYEATVEDPQGNVLWRRSGLAPTAHGTFHLAFRRPLLPPGRYQVQLFGRDGERRVPLAVYDLRLTGAQDR